MELFFTTKTYPVGNVYKSKILFFRLVVTLIY